MIRMGDKGFTLIELITFIIIGGIFLPTSLIAFSSVMSNFSTPDYQVKARFYAEQKMEEVTSQPFNAMFCSAPNPDTPEANYSRACSIIYVRYNGTNNSIENAVGTTTYKKITVTVTPPGGSTYIYDISTIVSKRPKLP